MGPVVKSNRSLGKVLTLTGGLASTLLFVGCERQAPQAAPPASPPPPVQPIPAAVASLPPAPPAEPAAVAPVAVKAVRPGELPYRTLSAEGQFVFNGYYESPSRDPARSYSYAYQEFAEHSYRLYLMNEQAFMLFAGTKTGLYAESALNVSHVILNSQSGVSEHFNFTSAGYSDSAGAIKLSAEGLLSKIRSEVRGKLDGVAAASSNGVAPMNYKSSIVHTDYPKGPTLIEPSPEAVANYKALTQKDFRFGGSCQLEGSPQQWTYFIQTSATPTPSFRAFFTQNGEMINFAGGLSALTSMEMPQIRVVCANDKSDAFTYNNPFDYDFSGWGYMKSSSVDAVTGDRMVRNAQQLYCAARNDALKKLGTLDAEKIAAAIKIRHATETNVREAAEMLLEADEIR